MKKTVIAGIDFSKKTLDVTCLKVDNLNEYEHKQFTNNEDGCLEMISWLKKKYPEMDEWLVCGEYTGIYSMTAAIVFNDYDVDFWLENPSQIKLSTGISREKNDKLDSLQIALYATRFQDRVKLYKPQSEALQQLRDLVRYKDRLTKAKTQLSVAANELKTIKKDLSGLELITNSTKILTDEISTQIESVEKQMIILLKADPELNKIYKLINSVVGVGMQTAIYLMIHTCGFKAFENPRQLACYCGVVPFAKQSGTSLKGKARISQLANKKIKTLLHMCALNAVRYDPSLKIYYQRKLEEGKHKMSVLNSVRNKLLHRIYAVVVSGQEYDKNYSLNSYEIAA